jgi:hypothetical protein
MRDAGLTDEVIAVMLGAPAGADARKTCNDWERADPTLPPRKIDWKARQAFAYAFRRYQRTAHEFERIGDGEDQLKRRLYATVDCLDALAELIRARAAAGLIVPLLASGYVLPLLGDVEGNRRVLALVDRDRSACLREIAAVEKRERAVKERQRQARARQLRKQYQTQEDLQRIRWDGETYEALVLAHLPDEKHDAAKEALALANTIAKDDAWAEKRIRLVNEYEKFELGFNGITEEGTAAQIPPPLQTRWGTKDVAALLTTAPTRHDQLYRDEDLFAIVEHYAAWRKTLPRPPSRREVEQEMARMLSSRAEAEALMWEFVGPSFAARLGHRTGKLPKPPPGYQLTGRVACECGLPNGPQHMCRPAVTNRRSPTYKRTSGKLIKHDDHWGVVERKATRALKARGRHKRPVIPPSPEPPEHRSLLPDDDQFDWVLTPDDRGCGRHWRGVPKTTKLPPTFLHTSNEGKSSSSNGSEHSFAEGVDKCTCPLAVTRAPSGAHTNGGTMASTLTTPTTARIRTADIVALEQIALDRRTTVSRLIHDLVAAGLPHLASNGDAPHFTSRFARS